MPLPLRPEEGGAGAHGHHHAPLLLRQGQCPCAAGGELVHTAGGQAVDVPLHIGGAHAGEDHPLHIGEGQTVGGQVVAQRAEQAGHLILRPDPQHGDHAAVRPQPHNLCGGAADVDSQDHAHIRFPLPRRRAEPRRLCLWNIPIIKERRRVVNRNREKRLLFPSRGLIIHLTLTGGNRPPESSGRVRRCVWRHL